MLLIYQLVDLLLLIYVMRHCDLLYVLPPSVLSTDVAFVRFLYRTFVRICRIEYDQYPGIRKSVVGATGKSFI